MKDFKILFLGENDWAHISHRLAAAVNTITCRTMARVYTEHPHPFGYRQDITSRDELAAVAAQMTPGVDWVIYGGDGGEAGLRWFARLLSTLRLEHQPRAIRHAGSAFRGDPVRAIMRDVEFGMRVQFLPCDLYRFSEHLSFAVPFVAPVNLAEIFPRPSFHDDVVRIVHNPSNTATKGTDEIEAALQEAWQRLPEHTIDVTITQPGLSYDDVLQSRVGAHIYIDQLQPDIGGFGASACEAMGMGLATLAGMHNVPQSLDRFFPFPLIEHVVDRHALTAAVMHLVKNPEILHHRRVQSWLWARDVAGYEPMGRYLLQHLWARS